MTSPLEPDPQPADLERIEELRKIGASPSDDFLHYAEDGQMHGGPVQACSMCPMPYQNDPALVAELEKVKAREANAWLRVSALRDLCGISPFSSMESHNVRAEAAEARLQAVTDLCDQAELADRERGLTGRTAGVWTGAVRAAVRGTTTTGDEK